MTDPPISANLSDPRQLFAIISDTSAQFQELERQVQLLPLKEKAELAGLLLEQLETSVGAEIEQLWIEEARRRYNAYLRGELELYPGEDVMRRVRSRLIK
ncbi:MAG: putative addiction module component [Blastocatellia bacterium]|jgi:hypothetical protein|nr:putative addiction module component [Blastocatellia bacterium]